MRILFVCKHNRFRSKVAEAIFNKLNKNKNFHAESAGLYLDEERPYIEENIVKVMSKRGYEVGGKPRKLTKSLMKKFDLIILLLSPSDKIRLSNFSEEIIRWNVLDCSASDIQKLNQIINKIELKIKNLLQKIQKREKVFNVGCFKKHL